MRTSGKITDCAPSVTWSPIATPSWTCAFERMSQLRPQIAPSTIALRPTYVPASITLRETRACSRSVTPESSTEYGPTQASGAMRQSAPMNAGPSTPSTSSTSTPSPTHTLPRSLKPGIDSRTRSSSASKFACRYWSRLPMSCQ